MKVRIKLGSSSRRSGESQGQAILVKHQSLAYDQIRRKLTDARLRVKLEAVQWCRDNDCRGYECVSKGFANGFDARTINNALDEKTTPGQEREYCSILTSDEELTLVRYLKNRVRCLQALNIQETGKVVINILKVRRDMNKIGGRRFIKLSTNAQDALRSEKISRSFFNRLRTKYPELKMVKPKKVDLNRGLNVTRQMAEEYIDDLAVECNLLGIGKLEHVKPGVWVGECDMSRIIGHDETPQMINHGTSTYTNTKVFGVKGLNTETLTKSNRECVTVHPFSSTAGETLMTQVIFSGSGLSSHMAPNSSSKITNALISVNKSGVSDHYTLLEAYRELDLVLTSTNVKRPVIIIADGHASRFDEDVLAFLVTVEMVLFILHADTSGGTQMHDQCNARLHSLYDEHKDKLYNRLANINREAFMNILAECWQEFVTPEIMINAAKRVGISSTGLSVEWMNQAMFARAAALLAPPTPTKSYAASSSAVFSPVSPPREKNIRKHSVAWYQHQLEESRKEIARLREAPLSPDTVEGLMPLKRIEPKKSKNIRITQTHGSMRANDMLTQVRNRNQEEAEKLKKKKDSEDLKVKLQASFALCKEKCVCKGVCVVKGLRQCSVCLCVQKSQCSKTSCNDETGKKPVMILSSSSSTVNRKRRLMKEILYANSSDSDSDSDNVDDTESKISDDGSVIDNEGGEVDVDDSPLVRSEGLSLVGDIPLKSDEVKTGQWVVARYEGEKFLGKVLKKRGEYFNVHCLEKPFGVNIPQLFEQDTDMWYKEVFDTNVVPHQTQFDADGHKCRKWFWVY